jgi:hypothetical protein
MPQLVVSGAVLLCPFGVAPGALTVLPTNQTLCGGMSAGTIMDNQPLVNIPSFGMCMSPANPAVAAATAAALGVLTPMPCIPNAPAPWAPGSPTVQIGNIPALNNTCTCTCLWGGVIQISFPGQATTMVA